MIPRIHLLYSVMAVVFERLGWIVLLNAVLTTWSMYRRGMVASREQGQCGNSIGVMLHTKSLLVPAKTISFPGVVFLRYKSSGRHFCSGVMIALVPYKRADVILTAAECAAKTNGSEGEIEVVAGAPQEEVRHVIAIVATFITGQSLDGIALMKLNREIKFNPMQLNKQPVCLPAQDATDGNWGKLGVVAGKQQAPELHQLLTQPIFDTHTCIEKHQGYFNHLTMFCTDSNKKCQGDAGSPFLAADEPSGPWTVYGVISRTCTTRSKYASVYMKITHFLPWINGYLRNPERFHG